MGSFENTPVDYKHELCEVRKMMGLKTTDFDQLAYVATMLYLNCPDELKTYYVNTLHELHIRKTFIETGLLVLPQ